MYLYGKVLNQDLFCVIPMFSSGKIFKQCIKDKNAVTILINFICIYFGEGCAPMLMHPYVWEHSQPILQNKLMDFVLT